MGIDQMIVSHPTIAIFTEMPAHFARRFDSRITFASSICSLISERAHSCEQNDCFAVFG
jgi:hypothetical protein